MVDYKTNIIKAIRQRMASDPALCVEAMEIIHTYQVRDEYNSGNVYYANNMGFTPADARFLTSLCEWKVAHNGLTPKQISYVVKLMPKYARQIFDHLVAKNKIRKTGNSKFDVNYDEAYAFLLTPAAIADEVEAECENDREIEERTFDTSFFNEDRLYNEVACF